MTTSRPNSERVLISNARSSDKATVYPTTKSFPSKLFPPKIVFFSWKHHRRTPSADGKHRPLRDRQLDMNENGYVFSVPALPINGGSERTNGQVNNQQTLHIHPCSGLLNSQATARNSYNFPPTTSTAPQKNWSILCCPIPYSVPTSPLQISENSFTISFTLLLFDFSTIFRKCSFCCLVTFGLGNPCLSINSDSSHLRVISTWFRAKANTISAMTSLRVLEGRNIWVGIHDVTVSR